MRVTDGMLKRNGVADLQVVMRQIARTQEQLSTGLRFTRISEDPISAEAVMRVREDQRMLLQFERNMHAVKHRQIIEEAVINEMSGIIEDARQIAMAEGSANRNADTRLASANLVDHMIAQIISLGNTRVGQDYMFGGRQLEAPPFAADGTYAGDTQDWVVEIEKNFTIVPNRNGQTVFIDTGVLDGLVALRDGLRDNDPAAILAANGDLLDSYGQMQFLLADTGGRDQLVQATRFVHEETQSQLERYRSDLEDVDLAGALVEMAIRQQALQAALQAVSVGMNTNIAALLGR
jgi:flagellar hook-associated protein 3 FlgL